MPAEISVVIPTLNAEQVLPGCLAALMEGVMTGLIRELVVSDGGSKDATIRIAEAAGAVVVSGPASRGGQLRKGVQSTSGNWVLVVHADTQLEQGWADVVGNHVTAEQAAACFRLGFRARGGWPTWVAGWANLRSRLMALPYGDQGLLMPRSLYDQAGGYPDQPLMEDVALIRALPKPIVCLQPRALTSATRYQKQGWVRRGSRNLWTLARYFAGADPHDLADRYNR